MRAHNQILRAVLIGGLLMLGAVNPREVQAAPILDQSYVPLLPFNGLIVSSTQPVSQTFTVGIEGVLSSIEVQLARRNPAPTEGITVTIVEAPGGIPNYSSILASAFITPSQITTGFSFVSVDLLAAALDVAVGDRLAIYLTTAAVATGGGINPYAWGADSPGTYAGGGAYTQASSPFTGRDMGFRTFVEPSVQSSPEPASLALLAMGFSAGALARLRRRRGTRAV